MKKSMLISLIASISIPTLLYAQDVKPIKIGEAIETSVALKDVDYYKVHVNAGQTLTGTIDKMTADVDLRMQLNSPAGIHSFECKSVKGGTKTDSCSITVKSDTDVYMSAFGYKAADYRIRASVAENENISERGCSDTTINKDKPCSVSTFHNISVYWSPKGGKKSKKVIVKYRKQGSGVAWKNALKTEDLVYNPAIYNAKSYKRPTKNPVVIVKKGQLISKGDYRGSIVNLEPNTAYEIALSINGKTKVISATTWNESFLGKKISTDKLPINPKRQYNINKLNGSEDNYIIIDGEELAGKNNKYSINGKTKYNISITDSSYVVLRNFKLKNAKRDAIRIEGKSHHIVIENFDISHWGGKEKGYAKDPHSGIYSDRNVYSSVFQNNVIHDPRYAANSWGQYNKKGKSFHPRGAQAITLKFCKNGNNVIRYNNFFSRRNYFNDVIGGGKNSGAYGFMGPDSDIYGNHVANGYDDGIEVEGGAENIRVWHNFIEKTYVAIGNAPVTVGPLYIWRNIAAESAEVLKPESRAKTRSFKPFGNFLKMGSSKNSKQLMNGYTHIYNNTLLNLDKNGYGGIGTSWKPIKGKDSHRRITNSIIKNNILQMRPNVKSISNDKDNKNVVIGYNLLERTIPSYESETKLKLIATDDGTSIKGECINNIIPLKAPLLGAQAKDEATMKFGTNYRFTPPSNMANCK